MCRACTQPTLAPCSFGKGSGAGCRAAGSRSLAQPLVPNTHTGVIPIPILSGRMRVEILILTGTREIKPRCLQDQTHHGHTVGSPSMPAEEEEEEREVMPLCRTLPVSAAHPRASDWHAARRTDGLTAASLRSTAVYIWHTCFGLCRLTLQMAGRGVGSFFSPSSWWRKSQTQLFHTRRG